MIKPDKLVAHRPNAYALVTGPGSFIAAAAQRATRDGARHDRCPRDAADMLQPEAERPGNRK